MSEAAVGVVVAADRRARVAASGAFAMQGLCFAGVLTQVPALRDRFGFSELALSLILLTVPVVAGVGSLLAGALAPRVGSAAVLRVAGLGVCAGVAAIGLANQRPALYVAVTAFGLAVGAVDATMNMQGVAVQRRYGRSLIASCHAWWSIAGIVGSLVTAGTARLEWSLAASLGLVAVVGAVISLASGPWLLRSDGSTPSAASPAVAPEPGGAWKATKIPWRPLLLLGLAVMLVFIAESSTSNWSAVFLRDALDASRSVAPLGLAAYLAFQLAGRTVADRIVGRFGAVTTLAVGGLLAAAGFGIVAAASVPAVAIGGFAVVGVGLCAVVPLSFSGAGALDPHETGVAIARVNLFNYAGFVVGAALVGVIAEVAGLRVAFAVPAVLALGIVALAPAFRVVDRARSSRSIAF